MSFIGTIIAIAASFAIFTFSQTAKAESTASTADFEKYAQAYMAGFTANMQQTNGNNNGGGCSDPQVMGAHTTAAPAVSYGQGEGDAQTVAYHKNKTPSVKNITNSYNNYMSNTTNITKSYEKNINSKNTTDSYNKSSSVVVVKDSDGAVVSSNTSTSGDNKNKVDVENKNSNNDTKVTTVINDSFNKDSHDKTIVVKDSFNETNSTTSNTTNTTNNTTVIDDSFNSIEIKGGDKNHDHPKPQA